VTDFEPVADKRNAWDIAPMRFLLRIARARAFAAMAGVTAAAQAVSPNAPDPDPTYFMCHVARTGTFGHIWYVLNVPVDGSAPFHRVNWQIPDRAEGLRLSVQSDGPPPVDGRLNDRAWFHVTFQTSRPVTRDARIEIRRMPGERYVPEFAYAGPYQRLHLGLSRGLHAIETQGRWEELNAWMNGRDFLTFALVRRNGTVVAEDRLDAATISDAAGAIAAARLEVEAMAEDYRRRCEVPEPIVVT
jgi:hypothetical protein